ncbi:hypothetical protein CLV43_11833 [Umezawaea tangerina]|uniref:Uncharacterized protein n=1 Tax=Umezawaea tangerina TaxID=84725 RepID=A0A2T0SKR8_9PSEU|nr:hypothetical protein CLV43_11833 [Umezawaea tangerina]
MELTFGQFHRPVRTIGVTGMSDCRNGSRTRPSAPGNASGSETVVDMRDEERS